MLNTGQYGPTWLYRGPCKEADSVRSGWWDAVILWSLQPGSNWPSRIILQLPSAPCIQISISKKPSSRRKGVLEHTSDILKRLRLGSWGYRFSWSQVPSLFVCSGFTFFLQLAQISFLLHSFVEWVLHSGMALGRHSHPLLCILVRWSLCSSRHIAIYSNDPASFGFSCF